MQEYRQLSSIYTQELAAASETVDALRAESSVLRIHAFEAAAAAAEAASPASGSGRRKALPDFGSLSMEAPAPGGQASSLSEAGKLYACALGDTFAQAPVPPLLLRPLSPLRPSKGPPAF